MRQESCETLSTADVPASARVRRWNDFGSETLSSIVVDPADRDGFSARIIRLLMGGLGFTWMTTTASTARGYGGGVGAWAAPKKDAFLLIVQDQGRSRIGHYGREAVLEAGDMVLLDASRPQITEAIEPMSMVAIKLPIEQLLARLPQPDALAGIRLSAAQGRGGFASSVLLLITRTLLSEPEDDWGAPVSDIVLDVLAMACDRLGSYAEGDVGTRLRRRDVCAYIERHFENPELTIAGIAEALGLSTRSLQRLFFEIGATPRRYLLDRRLEAAAERLRRPGCRGGSSITEVALGAGFNDLSYFTRTFTRKHGLSPRAYRRAALGRA